LSALASASPRGSVIGPQTGLELHIGRPGGSNLIRDLVAGAPALAPFYAGHFRDPDAFRRKADAVHARLRPDLRARLSDAFVATTGLAEAKLHEVLAGRGLAVTTGQQTGLFGGPLYTVYKILSAVRLAESLESQLGEPVLPIFWIASDDHDWAEVNHTAVVDASDDVRRLALDDPEDAPRVPMSERALPDEIGSVVDDLAGLLADTEFSSPLCRLVRDAYRPGATMAAAFGTLMRGLLAGFDLALIDAAHPALKTAAAPILAREVADAQANARLVRAQTDRLLAAGYHEQVTVSDDAANVFMHEVDGRDRLTRAERGWQLRRTRRSYSSAELERLLADEPARFSPNVFLRPVVESALIPTVAYVAGPGEASYFAQIGCLFKAHGVEPPIVVPRHGVTIVEPRIRRLLDKFGYEPADFARPLHEITTEVVHSGLPAPVTGGLERLRATIEREYDELASAAGAIDPTLREWVAGKRNRALIDAATTERKIVGHLKKRRGDEIRQLRRVSLNLYPDGAPQERVLNLLPYLARYGPGLLRDIAAAMDAPLDRRAADWQVVDCG
jgi:bacillithiol biosynthesis cysteine-adding enzyme BshC